MSRFRRISRQLAAATNPLKHLRLLVYIAIGTLAACSTEQLQTVSPKSAVPATWQHQHGVIVQQTAGPQSVEVEKPFSAQTGNVGLDNFIQEALQHNTSIKIAYAAAHAARAAANAAGVDDLPSIDLNVNGSRFQTQTSAGRLTDKKFGLGVGLNWDIDAWGKLAHQEKAALLDYQLTQVKFEQTQLETVVSLLKQWFQLSEAELQIDLINKRVNNLAQSLVIIEEGYRSGINKSLDVYLAKATLATERAKLLAEQQRQTDLSQSLEILLGRLPSGQLKSDALLPLLANNIIIGMPSDLLQQRPDIQAAYLGLLAANERLAFAHKSKYPSFILATSLGTSSADLKNIVHRDYFVWSLLASMSQSLFDFGKLDELEKQKFSQAEAAEAGYRGVLLQAFLEVEQALSRLEKLSQRYELVNQSVADYQAADTLAFDQYQAGLVDYVTVLESQRRLFDAQSNELQLRNEMLQNRVDLNLALGGQIVGMYQ